jgi:NADH dehydrogenase
MILITGGTGFIGKVLARQLMETGAPVRLLIRPSARTPDLPSGQAVEATLCSLKDARGLRAAMVGVDTVFHLAGSEWRGTRASLYEVDIQGTRAVVEAAAEAGVKRFFFVSHLGADRSSAYPVLKAKGIAEEFIRRSGMQYTILRSAIVFGPGDGFTTGLARLLASMPSMFLIPGDGKTMLQPFWVEDLVTCLVWSLEEEESVNKIFELGGPEYLSMLQIVELVMETIKLRRRIVKVRPPYLRGMTVVLEALFPGLPISVYWLDYLAANRTTALDTAPRAFNLMPARFSQRLGYLRGVNWRSSLFKTLLQGET